MKKKFRVGQHADGANYKYADCWIARKSEFRHTVCFDTDQFDPSILRFAIYDGHLGEFDSVEIKPKHVRKFAAALLRLADEVDPEGQR